MTLAGRLIFKVIACGAAGLSLAISGFAFGAQLDLGARSAIPRELQQLTVVDFRVMQNSQAAMERILRRTP